MGNTENRNSLETSEINFKCVQQQTTLKQPLNTEKLRVVSVTLKLALQPVIADLSKDCVLIVKFICTTQCKEKLTSVIVGPSICHSNKSSSIKSQSRVELILAKTKEKRTRFKYENIFSTSLATSYLHQQAHTEYSLLILFQTVIKQKSSETSCQNYT